MQVTISFIEYWARTAAAAQRGRDLHNSFSALFTSQDNTLLWGSYPGREQGTYQSVVSLAEEDAPRFRCSCPSRQTPCKHVLGLLWARLLTPERFALETPPENLILPGKRKQSVRKTSKNLVRQRDGLALTLALMRDILSQGAAAPPLVYSEWKALARSLSEYGLPGVGIRLLELLNDCAGGMTPNSLFLFASLYHKTKKTLQYLDRRITDPSQPSNPETESFMGKIWYLDELSALGQTVTNASLLQLTFGRYDDTAARRYIDRAYWIELKSGKIYETQHIIPYEAASHIQPEDSCFSLVHPERLYIYPGGTRARWEACRLSDPHETDFQVLASWASDCLTDIFPSVTDRLFKSPENPPVALVRFRDIGRFGGRMALRDTNGLLLPLRETATPVFEPLTSLYSPQYHTVLLRFSHDFTTGEVLAEPLCLISDDHCQRLSY